MRVDEKVDADPAGDDAQKLTELQQLIVFVQSNLPDVIDAGRAAQEAANRANEAAERAESIAGTAVDETLTRPGAAADAAVVGRKFDKLSEEIGEQSAARVWFGKPLPQTKTDAVMTIRIEYGGEVIEGYCVTKAQGSSSMGYPKKNQTVKLYKDAACTQKMKVSFRNWGEQYKFCFKANWIDITHARNVVTARLWGDVVKSRAGYMSLPEELRTSPNQGAIDGFPALVYSDGVYQGRYTINIPKDAWMANMDDEDENYSILCGETNNNGATLFRGQTAGNDVWKDEIHDAMPDGILTSWNAALDFVQNSTDEEFVAGLGNHINVESVIDYNLMALLDCGIDGMGKNQLYFKYPNHVWIASAYDLDSTWGLYWDGGHIIPASTERTAYEDRTNGRPGNLLYQRIEALMPERLIQRWEELKKGALSATNILNRFDEFASIVPADVVAEDYALTTEYGAYTAIPSTDTNTIYQIRDFVAKRMEWVDNYLDNLVTVRGDTPVMAAQATWFNAEAAGVGMNEIVSITFDADYEPTGEEDASWACDADAAGNIMAYRNGVAITIKPTTARRLRLNKNSKNAFSQMSALEYIDGTEMWLADNSTVLDSICNGDAALLYPVHIPAGVQYMSYAFSGCAVMRYAQSLPAGLLGIKTGFSKCYGIKELPEIPASVVQMDYAFNGCANAIKMPSSIPAGVTSLVNTFRDYNNITGTLEINATNVSTYTECFFRACSASEGVVLTGSCPQLAEIAATNVGGKVTVATV